MVVGADVGTRNYAPQRISIQHGIKPLLCCMVHTGKSCLIMVLSVLICGIVDASFGEFYFYVVR